MMIPKYIEIFLRQRTNAAYTWLEADRAISDFIVNRDLEDDVDIGDYNLGVEALLCPEESAERIRKAITKK